MPIGDWQFWVVSICALVALGYLLRNVLPVPFLSKRAKNKSQQRRATLTISAKAPASQLGEGKSGNKAST
jgi:hypothetical protein